jgi:hypothetical protein
VLGRNEGREMICLKITDERTDLLKAGVISIQVVIYHMPVRYTSQVSIQVGRISGHHGNLCKQLPLVQILIPLKSPCSFRRRRSMSSAVISLESSSEVNLSFYQ